MRFSISKMTIRNRFILLASVLIAMQFIASGSAILSLHQVGSELDQIANEDIPITKMLTNITTHQLEQAIHFERAVRYGELQEQESHAIELMQKEFKMFFELSTLVEKELDEAELKIKDILSLTHAEHIQKEFEHVGKSLLNIHSQHKNYEKHSSEVFELLKQKDLHNAELEAEKVTKEEDLLNHRLEELLQEIENFTEQAILSAAEHERNAEMIQIIIFIVSFIVAIALSWLVSKVTQSHLDKIGENIKEIASGNLTVEITGDDEVNQPLRQMNEQLIELVYEIQTSSQQLSSTVEQVTSSMQQTSNNIDTQQTQTESVAAAVAEMNASSKEVANNVQATAESAEGADEETNNGQRVLQNAITEIKSLSEQLNNASEVIVELEKDSDEISTVLEVISGIAEQTNLLALNAAIEAARAGEQGRGFAVVADEVRTLAGRTQESTESIKSIIDKLQKGSKQAVKVIEQSCDQSEKVVEESQNAGHSLEVVTEAINNINNMSKEISAASHEQINVTEEIDQSVLKISEMGSHNSSEAKQTSSAMSDVKQMTVHLKELAGKFRLRA